MSTLAEKQSAKLAREVMLLDTIRKNPGIDRFGLCREYDWTYATVQGVIYNLQKKKLITTKRSTRPGGRSSFYAVETLE